MCQIALAPCSPFSVTRELMRDTAELARTHEVRLHTHLGETGDENEFCLAKFGMRPLDYLEDVGWLAGDVWLAHGIHFTQAEIERLGEAGTGICHCPSSNMVLASGICPVNDLLSAGARVGLGVDGSRVQRLLQPDAGSPPGTAHRAAPVRCGRRHPRLRAAARHPRRRGSARPARAGRAAPGRRRRHRAVRSWTSCGSAGTETLSPRSSCAARRECRTS